jgi:hypothetical protein
MKDLPVFKINIKEVEDLVDKLGIIEHNEGFMD